MVGRSGPVEPSIHPIKKKDQQSARSCARAVRVSFLVGIWIFTSRSCTGMKCCSSISVPSSSSAESRFLLNITTLDIYPPPEVDLRNGGGGEIAIRWYYARLQTWPERTTVLSEYPVTLRFLPDMDDHEDDQFLIDYNTNSGESECNGWMKKEWNGTETSIE